MQNSTYDPKTINDFEKTKIISGFVGIQGICPAGQTYNLDHQLTDDVLFTGGEFYAKNSTFGDVFSLKIVHPVYGVVNTFVNNFGVIDDSQVKLCKESIIPGKLPAGLTIRISYTSLGAVDVNMIMNLYLYKVLE